MLRGSPDMHGFAGRANQREITCHVGSVYKVKLTPTKFHEVLLNRSLSRGTGSAEDAGKIFVGNFSRNHGCKKIHLKNWVYSGKY